MGGDVFQWDEALISGSRGVRGGSFNVGSSFLQSSTRSRSVSTIEQSNIGFRVATVPEPSTLVLVGLGFMGLVGYVLHCSRAA